MDSRKGKDFAQNPLDACVANLEKAVEATTKCVVLLGAPRSSRMAGLASSVFVGSVRCRRAKAILFESFFVGKLGFVRVHICLELLAFLLPFQKKGSDISILGEGNKRKNVEHLVVEWEERSHRQAASSLRHLREAKEIPSVAFLLYVLGPAPL